MRILIVNDDGVNGPGLTVAEEIAAEIAGRGAGSPASSNR